jgi:hypothetical protein
MSTARKKAKTRAKTSGLSPTISLMVTGNSNLGRLTVHLGHSSRMCLTLRSPWKGEHSGLVCRKEDDCVRNGCCQPPGGSPQPCPAGRSNRKPSMGVSLLSHLAACCHVWSQSCCHLAKMHRRRNVLKSKLRTPGTRKPSVVVSLAAASAASLPLIHTWTGIHASIILKSCLETVWEVERSSKISGWVRTGECRP